MPRAPEPPPLPPSEQLLFKSLPLDSCDGAPRQLRVEGALPPWLRGCLFRNGPGAWEPAGSEATGAAHTHLFDGYALIHRLAVDGAAGTVSLARRFVETRSLRAAREGRMLREFGTEPCQSLFGRAKMLFQGVNGNEAFSDNTNVVVTALGGELVALTEVPLGFVVDPATLATVGPFTRSPEQQPLSWNEVATIVSAHRLYHPSRRAHVTVATRFTPPLYFYDVVVVPEDRPEDEVLFGARVPQSPATGGGGLTPPPPRPPPDGCVVHRLPVAAPAYQHSFALTEDFVVMTEHPMLFSVPSLLGALLGGAPITDMFPWSSRAGTHFRVVHLPTGAQVARIPAPPLFTFHHVNAFQRVRGGGGGVGDAGCEVGTRDSRCCGGSVASCSCRRAVRGQPSAGVDVAGVEVVVDLIAYDSPGVIHDFTMDKLRGGLCGGPNTRSSLRRFVLRLDEGTATEDAGWDLPVLAAGAPSGGGSGASAGAPLPRVGTLGADAYLELPCVHPALVGRPYRYAYTVRAAAGCMMDGLLKLDMHARTALAWGAPGCAPSEPVFVPRPRPGGAAGAGAAPALEGDEDDGVVLSVVTDQAAGGSFLLVLDARRFTELARAHFPAGTHAPMSFHGTYLRARDGQA